MAITRYHIGCPVWKHKAWVGEFFSDDAKPSEFLQQYASVFNAVEGNSTFYGMPADSTIQKWVDEVGDGFKFCFKMPRVITHDHRLRGSEHELERFFELMEPAADHVGPFMIQLAQSFGPDDMPYLERFLDQLPARYSYAVEVRHPDFFDKGRHEGRLNRLLQSYHVDRIIFDTRKLHSISTDDTNLIKIQRRKPQLPVRFETTSSRPVVRFVGHNNVADNLPYLKEWAIITAEWIREGLHPYIFIHAPDEFYAPANARRFHRLLADMVDLDPMPQWPADRQDREGQMRLF